MATGIAKTNWWQPIALAGALGAGLFGLLAVSVEGETGRDYLSPELRYQVERLKAEVAEQVTTAATLRERAEILWMWANAYALSGGILPPNLAGALSEARYSNMAQEAGFDHAGFGFAPGAATVTLDHFIRELQVKDEFPDSLDQLQLSLRGPVLARSWQSFTLTYTVGKLGMAEGGQIALGKDSFADHGRLQADNPAADNYVSIRSSNPSARFARQSIPERADRVEALTVQPQLIFRLEGTALEAGETIHVVYGDRAAGSRGFLIQSYSVDAYQPRIYLDLEASGHFFTPRWPSLQVLGKDEVVAVRAFAPSVVATGELFSITVRSEDRFYNRSAGHVPSYKITLNGRPHSRIPAGDRGLVLVSGLRLDKPGVYRFALSSDDGKVAGSSNPIWVRREPANRIFWGETHGHSRFAEGQGTIDGYYRFSREDARLDFSALSEHDLWLDDGEWQTMQKAVREYSDPGAFVPLLSYEWTAPTTLGGHHNIFFQDTDRQRVGSQVAPLLEQLYEGLRRAYREDDVLVIPHAHMTADWRRSDPTIERLVEITSMHGTFESFGNNYLKEGWEVGFVGASDNHHNHPGYSNVSTGSLATRGGLAAVMANERTADSLFSAMRARQTYATDGERIILDARLGDATMGTRLPAEEPRRIDCRIMGTVAIDRIDVVKNGSVVYSRHYLSREMSSRAWVQVAFESTSEVFQWDNPRGYRIWRGRVEVKGARIRELRAPGLDNPHQDRAVVNEKDPARIDFRIFTRGRADILLVGLDGAGPDTTFTFHLEATRERGQNQPTPRGNQDLPAEQFELRLGDLEDGRTSHELRVPDPSTDREHVDRVRLQLVDLEGSADRTLEYTDLAEALPGDYYYLRVTQIDGRMAWSSPFWVGGKARE